MNVSTRIQETTTAVPQSTPLRKSYLSIQVNHNVFVGSRCTGGVCTDINQYGMRAEIPYQLSVGEVVGVDVEHPTDRFQAFARVTYRNEHRYGLYFVDLDMTQRQKLAAILMRNNNGPSILQ